MTVMIVQENKIIQQYILSMEQMEEITKNMRYNGQDYKIKVQSLLKKMEGYQQENENQKYLCHKNSQQQLLGVNSILMKKNDVKSKIVVSIHEQLNNIYDQVQNQKIQANRYRNMLKNCIVAFRNKLRINYQKLENQHINDEQIMKKMIQNQLQTKLQNKIKSLGIPNCLVDLNGYRQRIRGVGENLLKFYRELRENQQNNRIKLQKQIQDYQNKVQQWWKQVQFDQSQCDIFLSSINNQIALKLEEQAQQRKQFEHIVINMIDKIMKNMIV